MNPIHLKSQGQNYLIWVIFFCGFLSVGCSTSIKGLQFDFGCSGKEVSGDSLLKVHYMGVGCMYFEWKGNAVLTDPFWSNPSKKEVFLGEVRSRPERIEAGLPDLDQVRLVLIGHGHYDHLMDLPYLKNKIPANARILGSQTAMNLIHPAGFRQDLVVMNEKAADANNPGEWEYDADSTIRIMAVRSAHLPLILGTYFGKQRVTEPLKSLPKKAGDWKEGQSLGYLIDFLQPEEEKPACRIFIQTTMDKPPAGLFPESLVTDHQVNLAVLPPAAGNKFWKYRGKTLRHFRNSKIMLCHWEDIFRPRNGPQKAGAQSKLKKSVRNLQSGDWDLILPFVNTVHCLKP